MASQLIRRFGYLLALVVILASATVARGQAAAGVTATGDTGGASTAALPSAPTVVTAPLQTSPYDAITAGGRIYWILGNTVNPLRIVADVGYAGIETAENKPEEYGPHLEGFGKRIGIVVAGTAISNTMEATLGSVWGEDPRYFRVPDQSFGSRLGSVIRQTFVARNRGGDYRPAYARFIAIPGSAWVANTYLPDSVATNEQAAIRTLEGFGARMGSNAWDEFWPDIKAKIFHHGSSNNNR